jgi:hypothetical protein
MGLSLKGLMRAAPPVLVPTLEVPLLLWTRDTYIELHPAEVLRASPTISRALGDPAITGPFTITILAISALIGVSVFFIVRAYFASIDTLLADNQRLQRAARTLVVAGGLAQAAGTFGMVITSYVHLGVSRDVHMTSSYIFFSGQSLAIVLSGIVCAILRNSEHVRKTTTSSPGMLDPAMNGVRFKAAIAISAGAVIYLILFLIKDMPLPVTGYFVQYVYTIWEIIILAAFVVYLALFAPDLYHAGKDHTSPRRFPPGQMMGYQNESGKRLSGPIK